MMCPACASVAEIVQRNESRIASLSVALREAEAENLALLERLAAVDGDTGRGR